MRPVAGRSYEIDSSGLGTLTLVHRQPFDPDAELPPEETTPGILVVTAFERQ